MTQTIVIAGGTGAVGSACTDYLRLKGYRVYVLSRRAFPNDPDSIQWDPDRTWISENVVDGAHAVIHLTGRGLPEQRWTKSYKKILYDSRVVPGQYLGELIEGSHRPPAVYIGMSAAGIYGDAGPQRVSEADVPETSGRFVVELVQAWEETHRKASRKLRSIILRCPPVLMTRAGFLPRMLGPTRFGIYPYFGRGQQILSWVAIDDLCRAVHHCIKQEEVEGVYNIGAEGAVTSREFIKRLQAVKGGFGVLVPVPKVLIRIVFGQMAQILFDSIHVDGEKFRKTGFTYAFDVVDSALRDLIKS